MIDFGTIQGNGDMFFLRHGQSTGNVAGVAQGRADFPLSDLGREQAARCGHWFADKNIRLVASSPLKRSLETAEIIAASLGLGVEVWQELNEVDIGPFSGLTWQESEARFPLEMRRFRRYSWDGVHGAEHSDLLFARAKVAWARLLASFQAGDRNTLAVTHSGTLQWIIKSTFGHHAWLPLLPMPNCGVFQFGIRNDTVPPDEHLDEATPAHWWAWRRIGYQIPG